MKQRIYQVPAEDDYYVNIDKYCHIESFEWKINPYMMRHPDGPCRLSNRIEFHDSDETSIDDIINLD